MREFRAAWVATVANIDWPSTNTISVAEQKVQLLRILDAAAKSGLNAVIFQVRPACDAIYPSKLEPWSEFLTGAMGRAPSPHYDPLAMAVSEAHKRGLELHAWFNPYRALHSAAKSPVSRDHISVKRPDLVRKYGKYLWLDPGEKAVQEHSLKVVMDVVKRYDVDGVHFDDYFYPYKETDGSGRDVEFPDDPSWKKYGTPGKSRDDWRRENVNVFVQRVYKSVKAAKPWVKFGISPFGIWRPGNPPQIKGYDQYEKLYADARLWLREGWVDYFAPQLYWAIDPPAQSFPVLLRWWAEQNQKRRHLWPGMNTYNVGRKWKPEEIANQIRITRSTGANGHIHWNMTKGYLGPTGLRESLQAGLYAQPALVPASPWLSTTLPSKPRVSAVPQKKGTRVSWTAGKGAKTARWVVQYSLSGKWVTSVLSGATMSLVVPGKPDKLAVSAVDRFGNQSAPAGLMIGAAQKS